MTPFLSDCVPEELTIQNIFPEETEVALKTLSEEFTDVTLQHLSDPPTCNSPMREKIALLQHVFRTKSNAAVIIKAEKKKGWGGPIYDVEYMRARTKTFVAEINEFMQGYRILCVTTHKDSERMWKDYAANHQGIELRIEPNLAKDSKFQLFRPVIYRDKRPSLYDHTLEFVATSLFGDQEAQRRAMMETIVYAKTLEWEHESEYRLAIPVGQNERPWDTLPYHPEEITELYTGIAMDKADMREIVGMAQTVNPNILIFHGIRDEHGTVRFESH